MKALLLLAGILALTGIPAHAGAQVFVSIGGGGYHGNYFAATGSRCGYSAGYYNPYRSCGYVGYPGYYTGGYGYYGGYVSNYYPVVSYDSVVYAPSYVQPTGPAPAPAQPSTPVAQPPVNTPGTATTQTAPPPAQAQLPFGVLDVNGFVHSPYSDAIFKVPGIRNAQLVYDPVTGKPFLVR